MNFRWLKPYMPRSLYGRAILILLLPVISLLLVISIVSMLLTPADPMSMLLMAIPLTMLYFAGIGFCKYMPKRKGPFSETIE